MAEQWISHALDTLASRMAALGVEPIGYRKDGRAIWPIRGAEDPPAPPDPPAPNPPTPPVPPAGTGFPANTPLEQMTGEQREAYWRHYARQHEQRVKDLGNLTPEQLKELREKAEKHDAMELELSSEAEKAARKAADDAKAATRAEYEPDLINARLDAAAARAGVSEEDLAKAVEFVDVKKFLASDGSIDTDKVKAFVATIAPVKGTPPKGPTVTGHGSGSGAPGSGLSGLSGSELYDRLHPKKTA